MICSACWRDRDDCASYPEAPTIALCAPCGTWLRRLVPMGLDGSEAAKLARRLLATWADPARAARRRRESGA